MRHWDPIASVGAPDGKRGFTLEDAQFGSVLLPQDAFAVWRRVGVSATYLLLLDRWHAADGRLMFFSGASVFADHCLLSHIFNIGFFCSPSFVPSSLAMSPSKKGSKPSKNEKAPVSNKPPSIKNYLTGKDVTEFKSPTKASDKQKR